MMHLYEGARLERTFQGDNAAFAVWLMSHPDTHDYEWTGMTYRLRWRAPWTLIEAMTEGK